MLRNSDAEEHRGRGRGGGGKAQNGRYFKLAEGWVSEKGEWVAQTGKFYSAEPHTGSSYLRPLGSEGPAGARESVVSQTVPLRTKGAPSHVRARVACRTSGDPAEVQLELLDAERRRVGAVTSGLLAVSAWRWVELWHEVPENAAFAKLTLRGDHERGKIVDVFFDSAMLHEVGAGFPSHLADVDPDELNERFAAMAVTDPARVDFEIALAAGGRRQAGVLLDSIEGLEDVQVVERVVALIAEIGPKRVVSKLSRMLAKRLRGGVRGAMHRVVVQGLARVGDRTALSALSGEMKGDTKKASAMLRLLGSSGAGVDDLWPLFAPFLKEKGHFSLRMQALQALGRGRSDRFLTELTRLAETIRSTYYLKTLFALAADYDTVRALQAMLLLAEEQPAARTALLYALPRMRSLKVREQIRALAGHTDRTVRLAAVRALAVGKPTTEDFAVLRGLASDPHPLVSLDALEALGAIEDDQLEPGAVSQMLEQHLNAVSGVVASTALRSLHRQDPNAARLVEAVQHKHWQVRAAACSLMPPSTVADHVPAIVQCFHDGVWQVRVSAYRALAKLETRDAVAQLVSCVANERGTALHFLNDVLVALTHVDFSANAVAWEEWWAVVADEFDPKTAKADGPKKKIESKTSSTYYGIPIRSDALVFVIDLSGSMTAKVRGKSRLRHAKDNLIEVLKSLRPTQTFGLIGFGTDVHIYAEDLQLATTGHVEAAVAWIENLTVRGSTNIFDSLETALAMEGVESIFLLSDGSPSVGQFVDGDEIRSVIARLNRDTMVRINTILIDGDQKRAVEFMRELAAENHGQGETTDT